MLIWSDGKGQVDVECYSDGAMLISMHGGSYEFPKEVTEAIAKHYAFLHTTDHSPLF